MPQDNSQPEQEQREAGIKNQELREQKTETATPTTPEQKQPTGEAKKPEIPETTKPEMPKEEGIPKGGPGDQQAQTQAQPQASAQTQTPDQIKKERVRKVKGQLSIKIPEGTPAERKVSGQIEDWHSNNILNQP